MKRTLLFLFAEILVGFLLVSFVKPALWLVLQVFTWGVWVPIAFILFAVLVIITSFIWVVVTETRAMKP